MLAYRRKTIILSILLNVLMLTMTAIALSSVMVSTASSYSWNDTPIFTGDWRPSTDPNAVDMKDHEVTIPVKYLEDDAVPQDYLRFYFALTDSSWPM